MPLAALVLLASTVVLRDGVDVVPPGEWRYDQFVIKELPVTVDCSFRVDAPGKARIELVTREALDRSLRGESHDKIAVAEGPEAGRIRQEIGVPGTFAMVVYNDDKSRAARVALRLSLDFSRRNLPGPRYVEPRRKLTIILLSFFGFLAVLIVSARKLLGAMRR